YEVVVFKVAVNRVGAKARRSPVEPSLIADKNSLHDGKVALGVPQKNGVATRHKVQRQWLEVNHRPFDYRWWRGDIPTRHAVASFSRSRVFPIDGCILPRIVYRLVCPQSSG